MNLNHMPLTRRQADTLASLKPGAAFSLGRRFDPKWGIVPRDVALALEKRGLVEVFQGPDCLMVKLASPKGVTK